jgi:hypothetical protein
MFNSQAGLQIVDVTRPESPCAAVPQTGAAEEDTSLIFGPMQAPIATTCLSPPTLVVTPLDKGDRSPLLPIGSDDDVVKSPSPTPVHIAAIKPLALKQAVIEHSEPGSSSAGLQQPISPPCYCTATVEPTEPSSSAGLCQPEAPHCEEPAVVDPTEPAVVHPTEPAVVHPTELAVVDPTKPSSSAGPHPVKKVVERWPRDDRFPDFPPDNTKIAERPFEAWRSMHASCSEVTCPELRVQPALPVCVSIVSPSQ